MDRYDVVIIGAGVSGTAIARELSKYELNICVIEKESDVCCGTSKANSAIVHAGFDAKPGTLMARLNVRGQRMMDEMCEDLEIPFNRIGSIVAAGEDEDASMLEELRERGIKNGLSDLRILDSKEAHELEPGLSERVSKILYVPEGGIICPFELNIAMAENAFENGVSFKLWTMVDDIKKNTTPDKAAFELRVTDTKNDKEYMIEAGYVVNAAGVYADHIHNMVSDIPMHITARKGQYFLLDDTVGDMVSHTIFGLPGEKGKGILVTPSVYGNILIGPTAEDEPDKEGVNTTEAGLEALKLRASANVRDIPFGKVITSFAGLRAHEDRHDFIIQETDDAKGFIDCAGIESPGLSAAPAIGEYVREIFEKLCERDGVGLKKNTTYKSKRKGLERLVGKSDEELDELIKRDPAYGNIICRCVGVSEGEIVEAIRRPLGATTMDGIKRRVGAGMGRCQAGFCTPKVMDILCRELGIGYEDIRKNGPASYLVNGRTKKESI